ncbi:uncharacterized protein LOC114127592 [Aphis gossypii]|uniref:uncharacterized protein LOC114127592 n=1 Tax=Aphis gossypii TaxID=80765 RepID=UPI0021594ECC|nr:uncharacterized protein LOC114127592 [Aphis gossypii]
MSDDRVINVTNCTIYVGRVRIILESHPNVDEVANGVIETSRSAEDPQDDPVTNAPKKQTDFVSHCSTKPLDQRQLCTEPYAAHPKITSAGPTSQPSVCPRSSDTSCYLHGGGRCNHDEWSGTGNGNNINNNNSCTVAGNDDCKAAARNSEPPGQNDGCSPAWGTQNGGRLSPLRLTTSGRYRKVAQSGRPTLSRIPVPCLGRPEPPARQDRPVDLYAGSRLPVPVRPGPAPARIPRIGRNCDARPSLSRDDDRNYHTAVDDADPVVVTTVCDPTGPIDTDDDLLDSHLGDDDADPVVVTTVCDPTGPTDTDDDVLLDSHLSDDDNMATVVVVGQPGVCVDESAECVDESTECTTSERWLLPLALEDISSTGSRPLTVASFDDDGCSLLEGCRSGDRDSLSDLNQSVDSCVLPIPDDLTT